MRDRLVATTVGPRQSRLATWSAALCEWHGESRAAHPLWSWRTCALLHSRRLSIRLITRGVDPPRPALLELGALQLGWQPVTRNEPWNSRQLPSSLPGLCCGSSKLLTLGPTISRSRGAASELHFGACQQDGPNGRRLPTRVEGIRLAARSRPTAYKRTGHLWSKRFGARSRAQSGSQPVSRDETPQQLSSSDRHAEYTRDFAVACIM